MNNRIVLGLMALLLIVMLLMGGCRDKTSTTSPVTSSPATTSPASPSTVAPPPTPSTTSPATESTTVPPTAATTSNETLDDILTEEEFKSLLTEQDVQLVLVSQVELNAQFVNFKEMAESVDPQQVVAMDSFYGLSFQTADGMKAMTLAVIDFDSTASAEQHFQKAKTESGQESMQEPIGNDSFAEQLNSNGMGSIIIFLKRDKVVQIHTAMSEGESPIVDLSGLEELANKVEAKL